MENVVLCSIQKVNFRRIFVFLKLTINLNTK